MRRILKRIKMYKKSNRKGFTLIEMIGVIVLMGLILIAVLPSMSRLINRNDNQAYDVYYDLVEEAARVYAGTLGDKLGGSNYVGCAQVQLSDLINNEYVQAYEQDNKTCATGSGGIKIRNDRGSISINFQLECWNVDDENPEKYIQGKNDTDACNAFVMADNVNLKSKIANTISASDIDSRDSRNAYIIGTNVKNYVWYSGKLWRVVSYDKITEDVKLVTADSMTSIYYNHNDDSAYSGSDVETWLNNDFLNSLKDYQSFLMSADWNSTPNSSTSSNPSNSAKVKRAKVGLINTYEFGKIKAWYNSDVSNYSWLLSEGTSRNSLYTQEKNINTASSKSIYGVRPAVVVSADVLVYSGSGTKSDPYIIDNSSNAFGKYKDYLYTRYSGEYVSIDGKKYRIVSTINNTTKLIGTFDVGKYVFSDNYFDYSSSNIRKEMEANSLFESSLIVKGDFCTDTINNAPAMYQSAKCIVSSRINNSIRVGLPKIGDFFTTGISGINEYWTINPNTEVDSSGNHYNSTINVINSNGTSSTAIISSNEPSAVATFYLDSETVIISGKGTYDDPYKVVAKKDAENPKWITYNTVGGKGCEDRKMGFLGYSWDTLCTPTKDEYTFLGWFTSEKGGTEITASTKVKEDLTVYAHWQKAHYTITYDSNGGGECNPKQKQVVPGDAYGTLCKPTPPDVKYSFAGWHTSIGDDGRRIDEDEIVEDDITLYAHWTDKPYILTLNSNGGDACAVSSKSLKYGDDYGELCTPTKSGYKFTGWYTSSSAGVLVSSTTKIIADTTIYAHWTPIKYTIVFDANGGLGSTNSVVCTYDQACKLTKNNFTSSNSKWIGWSYGGNTYMDQDSVRNLTTVDGSTLHFKALWSLKKYTIIFDGGSNVSGSMANLSCASDSDCKLPLLTYVKPYYKFEGWSYNGKTYKDGETVRNVTSSATSVRFSAKWTAACRSNNGADEFGDYGSCFSPQDPSGCNYGYCTTMGCACDRYKISYNTSGGSSCTTDYRYAGQSYGTLCVAQKAGYTFAGWYTASSGGVPVNSYNVVTSDITLYAHWISNTSSKSCATYSCDIGTYLSNGGCTTGSPNSCNCSGTDTLCNVQNYGEDGEKGCVCQYR